MKICLIGKCPPIEGGVSTSTFWLAYGLAQRGHEVHVVTNADEVEGEYRMHLQPGDEEYLAPSFPASGGFVRVVHSERLSYRMAHIPWHNPFVTKLASIATQTIREHGCEAIFAHYFEPYGIAAYLASQWTKTPWIVRHAGSDLDRLMAMPHLSTAYKETLRAADGLVTRGALIERFLGMGVSPARIFSASPYAPPDELFRPGAPPLDVNALPHQLAPASPFDAAKPTIGIYGKVGVFKGSFDLLKALAILRRDGLDFNFVAMTQGRGLEPFAASIRELELADRTWVIPFLPNWRVPSFIRTCTAVCFLERDFPVKIHTPTVAQEVLLAGGCLVVSGEIARKQLYRDAMADGQNLFLVDEPKQVADLAAKLRQVIEAPEAARAIGLRGRPLVEEPGAFDRYLESWEQLLCRIAGRPSTAVSLAEQVAAELASAEAMSDRLKRILPWAPRLLGEEADPLLRRFAEERAASPRPIHSWVELGRAFCDFLAARLDAGDLAAERGLVEACLAFQAERWQAQQDDDEARSVPPFAEVDQLGGMPVAAARAHSLRPLCSAHARIVELGYDVRPLFSSSGHSGNGSNGARAAAAALAPRETTVLCFHRTPNLVRTELKISPMTRELLALCDGSRTIDMLVAAFAERAQAQPGDMPRCEEQVLGMLQTFYDQRVLVFCHGGGLQLDA